MLNQTLRYYIIKVSCGPAHTIALSGIITLKMKDSNIIDSGEVFAWGNGENGQLGLGNRLNQLTPQQIKLYHNNNETPNRNSGQPDSAIDISCGKRHTGIITSSKFYLKTKSL